MIIEPIKLTDDDLATLNTLNIEGIAPDDNIAAAYHFTSLYQEEEITDNL